MKKICREKYILLNMHLKTDREQNTKFPHKVVCLVFWSAALLCKAYSFKAQINEACIGNKICL